MIAKVGRGMGKEISNVPIGFGGELPAHSQGNKNTQGDEEWASRMSWIPRVSESVGVGGGGTSREREAHDQHRKR